MPGIKELKTRIKSIGSMRKVTRAMQMVSAAKMRKAQTAVVSSRDYSSLAWELISNLAANISADDNQFEYCPGRKWPNGIAFRLPATTR